VTAHSHPLGLLQALFEAFEADLMGPGQWVCSKAAEPLTQRIKLAAFNTLPPLASHSRRAADTSEQPRQTKKRKADQLDTPADTGLKDEGLGGPQEGAPGVQKLTTPHTRSDASKEIQGVCLCSGI
jgi:hypothetical protein